MLIKGVSCVDGDVENTLRKINGFLVMSLFHLKRVSPKSEFKISEFKDTGDCSYDEPILKIHTQYDARFSIYSCFYR